MKAVIDIGNSRIKVGLIANHLIEKTFSFANSELFIKNLSDLNEIDEIFFSSVVPTKSIELFELALSQSIKIKEVDINSDMGITVHYKTPQTLGIDRVCGILGAKVLTIQNAVELDLIISIDCGTATTINVLYQNSFLGGLIAPGISTMFSALNKNTSLLPELNFESYKELVGDSTETSIVSGVVNSTIGFINHSVHEIEKKFNTKATLFITGGNSLKLLPHLNDKNIIYEKDLVLKGIVEVASRMG
jgi:type III pantothenate kinase